MAKIKEQEREWKIFQGVPRLTIEDSINVLRNNYDKMSISNFVINSSYRRAMEIFEGHGCEIQEHLDEFEELRTHIQELARWNWDAIMPGPVFFRDPGEFEVFPVEEPDSPSFEKFKVYAILNRFSETQAWDIFSNVAFGGMAGVGVIGYMEDAINGNAQGAAILYIRDKANGIGAYFISGKKTITAPPEKLADLIDYGENSLGQIYATTDWEY